MSEHRRKQRKPENRKGKRKNLYVKSDVATAQQSNKGSSTGSHVASRPCKVNHIQRRQATDTVVNALEGYPGNRSLELILATNHQGHPVWMELQDML